ncbi:MerR family transcriptional regulator [uncultured Clostridium sp.]|uniref:MerR family transcriptional regulator n=1 Tax=uncultured Clostridium sp. TaxID=59620 RepID=UPI0026314587|nr:MerR family transcriptional regulator [uncultured Clostridium sp.]
MFRIGEFSKLSCLSIAMIRYYGEIGILEPSYVNKENGYRYYEAEQLYIVATIQSLKQVGFGISEIKELLGVIKEKEDLERIVNERYRKLECERESLERKLSGLKNILDGLDKGDYSQIHKVTREIGLWIKENNYEIVGKNFVVLHKGPYNTENIGEYITEVCYPVKKK